MRVIGIDPGTAIVGYGVVDFKKNKYEVVDFGCIYTSKEKEDEERLVDIYMELSEIIKKYSPEHMAIEELFYFKNNKTVIRVAEARGVIALCGKKEGLSIKSYTPLQVKMGITGYGRSEKKQVQTMVQKILKLDEVPKPDDAADALAIAVTHINSLKSGINLDLKGSINLKNIKKSSGNKLTLDEYKKLIGK